MGKFTRYIYKVIILFIIFIAACIFFIVNQGGGIAEGVGKNIEVSEESYPVLTVTTGGNTINRLYGYSGTMDPAIVRLSISPLDASKSLAFNVAEGKMKIEKLKYQILDKETKEIYEEKTFDALENNKNKIKLSFDFAFDTSTEYILSLAATMDTGRIVHYYTRLKYYIDDTHLKEKMDFALKFHNDTFSKDNDRELNQYLETSAKQTNSTLANVNINSDVDLVTWGKLSPKVISDIIPTVKEFNTETACFQLNYYVKGTTSSGEENFHVKEFFRVRFASGHAYLLGYERTMEAAFNEKMASINKNQLKIGITQDTDMDLLSSDDGKILYFVRDGVLYRYDMNKGQNKIHEVYRIFSSNASAVYTMNDENNIRMNKLDENGDLYFTVFGYMPRGEYEGKVAVILYRYIQAKDEVEEVVYLPMDSTYQELKEDFNAYSYVNSNQVYYLTVANVIYSYSIPARRLEIIAKDVADRSFAVLKSKNCIAWSSDYKKGYGDRITVYNLETDARTELMANNNQEYIRLLGTIDSNIIYGYVKKSDVKVKKDGTVLVPCYKMEIADSTGQVLKSYERKNKYVSDIEVNGNVLTMNRLKKSGSGYQKASMDSILNQETQEEKKVSLESRVTSISLTEWYINLPSNFVMTKEPELVPGKNSLITNERAVHLGNVGITKYYVYALGEITSSYESAAQAIKKADEQMGVVISSHHQIVWERGGSFLMNSVAGINMMKSGNGVSNIAACAYMVLKSNHYSVQAKNLSGSKKSIYSMLNQYMDRPVNLTGINLEQALYFVSNGKSVIAMTGSASAVVIIGYDQNSVTMLNPDSGKQEKMGRTQAAELFKNAGNHFISYMS